MEDLSLFDYFIKCLKKYACFKGRARRKEYWGYILFSSIFNIIISLFLALMMSITSELFYENINRIYEVFIWIQLVPTFAVTTRRLHDVDKNGLYNLLYVIPLGFLIIFLMCSRDSDLDENDYGQCPKKDFQKNCPTEEVQIKENLTLFGYFLKCWKKYACFKGRARKQEFWGYILFLFILNVLIFNALVIIDNIASGYYEDYINMVYEGLLILQILPTLAVTTRRLHDIDNNAVYNLLYIVPFGFIFLFIMCSRDSDIYENEYGPNLEGDDISNNSVDSEKDESENKS